MGEELLIIQEEFAGFEETKERLDLLALDKEGNLVIIENKLDDTGRDVTWQALKYASYCSTLTKDEIINIYQAYLSKKSSEEKATDKLEEFFDNEDYEDKLNLGSAQRIILIAGQFRKEVTSTVMWLLNYGLRVQCFKLTPFQMGENLLLNFDQIIPVKDAEDLIISMAKKTKEEISTQSVMKTRHIIRKEFWGKLLPVMNEKITLFRNISPGVYHWTGAGSGVRGLGFNFVISKSYGRAELYVDRGTQEENKSIFDFLLTQKEEIETSFGSALVWQKLEDKRASRIKCEMEANVFNKDEWEKMIEFMTDAMARLEKAFKKPLQRVDKKLKGSEIKK